MTIIQTKGKMKYMKNNIQKLTITALLAAFICMAGPIVIPVGVVPMSLANMAIYLAIILLDKKMAMISIVVYLLIGFVGLPVFSGFTGGAGKLLGPTGGYLIGYLVLSWTAGVMLEKFLVTDRKKLSKKEAGAGKKYNFNNVRTGKQILALAIGTIGLYFFGTLWLMYQSKLGVWAALSVGVLSFIPFDMIKIAAAVWLGNSIKKRSNFF